MAVTLICESVESGQVACSGGRLSTPRQYQITNHRVTVDGGGDEILAYFDVQELTRDGLYRLPTPSEQEGDTKTRVKKGAINENAVGNGG